MSDASTSDTLTPEVEVKPITYAFAGTGLVSGTPVASAGTPVQGRVTVTGLTTGVQYHWRARVKDASGQVSGWASFGGNGETARDFGVDTTAPAGSIVIDKGAAWTASASVSLKLSCTDTRSGCSQMQLSNDNVTFTPPEAFATTRAWTLSGGDARKTVYVRYIDHAGAVSRSYYDTITLDTTAPVVGVPVATPSPFAPRLGETTTIRFRVSDNLSGTCPTQIRILDAAGRLVKSVARSVSCPKTGYTTSMIWDGRDAARVLVPAGTYTIEVAVTDLAKNAAAVSRGTVVVQ
jgi:hypothetical protein